MMAPHISILCSLFLLRIIQEYFFTTASEPFADVLCWTLLLLVAFTVKWRSSSILQDNTLPVTSSWLITLGIVGSSLCQSYSVSGAIWPLLTLTLWTYRHCSLPWVLKVSQNEHVVSPWDWSFQIFVALLSSRTLLFDSSGRSLLAHLLFWIAQSAIYLPLDSFPKSSYEELSAICLQVGGRAVLGLSVISGARIWIEGWTSVDALPCVALAVTKALQWVLICSVSEKPPWFTVATSGTVAASNSVVVGKDLTIGRAVACVATSILAIKHTIDLLPSNRIRGISLLYAFVCVPLVIVLSQLDSSQFSISRLSTTYGVMDHPVHALHKHYKARFHAMIQEQSSTVQQAIAEYRHRYNRAPPRGFETWYEHAKNHSSWIIDDFDSIEESISSLRSFDPSRIRKAVEEATSAPSRLAHCSTHDGTLDDANCGWMGREISEMLSELNLSGSLPDTELLLNSLDEPRILPKPDSDGPVRWIDESRRTIWERVTKQCHKHETASRMKNLPSQLGLEQLPFLRDMESSKDLCLHPEYATMHGFFQSPTTFLFTEAPLPLLSPAKPSTFGDILYPPPYYMDEYDNGKYVEEDDPPWDEKENQLYWAGSTTGSHASTNNWRNHHRQRFVARANQLWNGTTKVLVQNRWGVWQPRETVEKFSQLYDIKFTAIIQCDQQQCNDEEALFHKSGREDPNAAFKHRFVFDLDGNSFSGRYYNLLASRSVVLKQTIFKEWHDDRLVPWVHYVPVSLDMGELPELMRYLALTEEGNQIAKEIADAGREWLGKALRKEDAGIYMYRLLLELGRLLNPETETSKER